MKFLIFGLSLLATAACIVLPRDDKESYNRRPDSEQVRQKLINYWSQPYIFAQLPEESKPQVEVPSS